jgi:hypothetical protein
MRGGAGAGVRMRGGGCRGGVREAGSARNQSKPLAQCKKLKKDAGGGQKKSGRWGLLRKQAGATGGACTRVITKRVRVAQFLQILLMVRLGWHYPITKPLSK